LKRLSLSAFLLLPMIAACSGGSTTPAPVPEPLSPPLTSSSKIQSNAEPESAPAAAVSADLLFIGNTGSNSITVYKHDAKGNTAPLRVIVGSKTGISALGQLSEDAQGNLYVANGHGGLAVSSNPAVLVFAPGANDLPGPAPALRSECF
jgi:hypothetical protein